MLFTHGGARHVNGYIAATDDHDLLADREAVAKIDVEKKIDPFHDPVQLMPRKIEVAAAVQAKREQHGFVALSSEVFQGKVLSEPLVQAKFRAEVENFTNLRLQNITGQAVFRNPEMHHSTWHRRSFENSHRITKQGQIVSGRHTGGTGTDDCDLFWPDGTWSSGKNIDGITRFRSMALGDETL